MAGGGTPGDGTPGDDAGRDDALRDNSDALRGMLLALITDAGAAVDSRFFGAADCLRRQMDDALLGRTVSVTMLDQWEESTAGYGAQYMTVPPLRLLCDVLLDFGDIRRMCAQRQPIECAERLCRLAAQLAGLTGMAMINLGDRRLARSFFRTARTAAADSRDRSRTGRQPRKILSLLSSSSCWFTSDSEMPATCAICAAVRWPPSVSSFRTGFIGGAIVSYWPPEWRSQKSSRELRRGAR